MIVNLVTQVCPNCCGGGIEHSTWIDGNGWLVFGEGGTCGFYGGCGHLLNLQREYHVFHSRLKEYHRRQFLRKAVLNGR